MLRGSTKYLNMSKTFKKERSAFELEIDLANGSNQDHRETMKGQAAGNTKARVCLCVSLVIVALLVAGIALLLIVAHFATNSTEIAELEAQQSTIIQLVSNIFARLNETDQFL